MKMKNVTRMTNEELLVQYESLMIRFVKEDDMNLDTTRTNEQIETVKDELLKRIANNYEDLTEKTGPWNFLEKILERYV